MFAKGQSGNPKGRKPGTPNRATRTVRETFEAVFASLQSSDSANLLAWAEQNPTDFYRLSAKLIPLQVRTAVDDAPVFTDVQRAAKIASLLALAASRSAQAEAVSSTDRRVESAA